MSQNSPRVLFYAPRPPPYSGPEIATEMILQTWGKLQRSITLIPVSSNVRPTNMGKGRFDLAGLRGFAAAYTRFLAALIGQKPAVVYLLLSSSKVGFLRDSLLILSARLCGKKVILHYRGGNFHKFFGQRSKLFGQFIRFVLGRVECVIVQAERLKAMFAGVVAADRLRVLYNGIDAGAVSAKNRTFTGPLTLLFMGHVAFSKGFYELMTAFRELRPSFSPRLLVAGTRIADRKIVEGFLADEVLAFYRANAQHIEREIDDFLADSRGEDVAYLGVVRGREKQELFNRADLLVLPSYTEGFSMTVLEAMANRMPVVVSRVGAFPEIIQPEKNGWLVEAGRPEHLVNTLREAISDPARLARIGENNRRQALQRFSLETITRQMEHILAGEPSPLIP